jgi:hypothetical protein
MPVAGMIFGIFIRIGKWLQRPQQRVIPIIYSVKTQKRPAVCCKTKQAAERFKGRVQLFTI